MVLTQNHSASRKSSSPPELTKGVINKWTPLQQSTCENSINYCHQVTSKNVHHLRKQIRPFCNFDNLTTTNSLANRYPVCCIPKNVLITTQLKLQHCITCISFGNVALNIRVWRSPAEGMLSFSTIRRICGSNPISSMRSASSSTRNLQHSHITK